MKMLCSDYSHMALHYVWRDSGVTQDNGFELQVDVANMKVAGQDWIGYHAMQSRATSPHWVAFVEDCSSSELALFGFPPPGHPIWDAAFIEATSHRYPKLDLTPWRAALARPATG